MYNAYMMNHMFKEALEEAEKEIYLAAYKHTRYNQVKAAEILGVSRGKFRTRLKKFEKWD